jgi:hypothetical protein
MFTSAPPCLSPALPEWDESDDACDEIFLSMSVADRQAAFAGSTPAERAQFAAALSPEFKVLMPREGDVVPGAVAAYVAMVTAATATVEAFLDASLEPCGEGAGEAMDIDMDAAADGIAAAGRAGEETDAGLEEPRGSA